MTDTPLRGRFDAMIEEGRSRGKVLPEHIRLALLEAFMAAAAAFDNIMREAMERTQDPQEIARVCDAMILEIENRESSP